MTLTTLVTRLQTQPLSLRQLLAYPIPTHILQRFACACADRALDATRKLQMEPDPRCWRALALAQDWLEDNASEDDLTEARMLATDAFVNVARRVRTTSMHMRAASARAFGATHNALESFYQTTHLHNVIIATSKRSIEAAQIIAFNLSEYHATSDDLLYVEQLELQWQRQHMSSLLSSLLQQRERLHTLLTIRHHRLDQQIQHTTSQWEGVLFG